MNLNDLETLTEMCGLKVLTNITLTKSVRFSLRILTQFLASFNNLTSSSS